MNIISIEVSSEKHLLAYCCRQAVHDRLGFEVLLGHKAWRLAAEEAGLHLLHYENLDRHMEVGYSQLARASEAHDFRSADGTILKDN